MERLVKPRSEAGRARTGSVAQQCGEFVLKAKLVKGKGIRGWPTGSAGRP
jgi:hypothetical protein